MTRTDADWTSICDAGGRTHLKLSGEGEDGRAVRASLLESRSARTWYHPSPSHPIWFCAHSSPPLRNGQHELTFMNSLITMSNFLGGADGPPSHIPSPPSSLMRTLAFSVNSVQISLTHGIIETVKTPSLERCAELALAQHRGEPRAALRTHSWLLGSSGFMRFILPASWTHTPNSTKMNAIFPANPEGRLQRTVIIFDY